MNLADVKALIERVTYKPGWAIRATLIESVGLEVRVGKVEADSEGKRDPWELMYASMLTVEGLGDADERRVLEWLFEVVERRELHEVEEWLRLDGRPLREPHPETLRTRAVLGPGTSLRQPTVPGDRL